MKVRQLGLTMSGLKIIHTVRIVTLVLFLAATGSSVSGTDRKHPPKRSVPRAFEEVAWEAVHGIAAVVIPTANQLGLPVGTAFFVNDEYLATNAHVIREAEAKAGNGAWAVRIPVFNPKMNRMIGYHVLRSVLIDIDDSEDVAAILKLQDKRTEPVTPFVMALGFPKMGAQLAFSGFGLLVDHPMTLTAVMASQGAEHFAIGLDPEQPISKRLRDILRTATVWVIDRPIPGGFSGSPVFLRESGVVYGIASGSAGDELGGLGFVHSVRALAQMLSKRSINFRTAEAVEGYFPK